MAEYVSQRRKRYNDQTKASEAYSSSLRQRNNAVTESSGQSAKPISTASNKQTNASVQQLTSAQIEMLKARDSQARKDANERATGVAVDEQEFYKSHPVNNFLVHNPVSQFIDKKILPALDVAGQQSKGVVTGDYSPVNGRNETTGNKTVDMVAKGVGTVAAFGMPTGGGASFAGAVRSGAETVASKLVPKATGLLPKIGKAAVTGAVESLPYSAQQIATQKDIKTPQDALKTVGTGLALGAAGEAGFSLAGAGIKKVGEALKKRTSNDAPLPKVSEPSDSGMMKAGLSADNATLPKAQDPESKPLAPSFKEPTIPEGQKERGFSRNSRTDLNNPDSLRDSVTDNPLTYEQITGKDTLAKADAVYKKGYEAARTEVTTLAAQMKPEAVPLAKMLARDAANSGNVQGAREILSEVATRLTEAGQFSQAARLLRESDPETFFMTIDKQLNKLNTDGAKQFGKKWKDIDLTPDELEAINKIPRGDTSAYEATWEQIGNRIAKELPSTGMEKFDAWRRIAMLLNPKTHIRNMVGNAVMAGMRKISDTMGAALEKVIVPTGHRTKSFGWSLNKDLRSKVDAAWEASKKDLQGGSRWEIDNLKSMNQEKRIFKNGAIQGLNDISFKTLNAEDNIFLQRAYKDALGGYMQANKLDIVTDAAQEYAKRRAFEATYKQANMISGFINKAKQVRGGGKIVEAAIPFSKTPANIMKNAFEYSPAGIIKTLYDVSAGKTAAQVIETLSKGMTGTGIAGLGFMLSSMGWAKSENEKSNKVAGIKSQLGEQPYSITTPLGSYTFDWMQPVAIPFAIGVAMADGLKKNDTVDYETIMDSMASGGDTFFNMSMLQNVKKLLGGSSGSTTESLLGLPWSYVQQAWPSIFGQVAKTVDDAKRSTYDPNGFKQAANTIISKTPFASKTLQPALDVWGQEQKQGGAVQQFISPGYIKANNNDPATTEIVRLYNGSKNTDILPKVAANAITVGGKSIKLTAEQFTEYQRLMGQGSHNDVLNIIGTPQYRSMSDDQKEKAIAAIMRKNQELAKKKVLGAGQ